MAWSVAAQRRVRMVVRWLWRICQRSSDAKTEKWQPGALEVVMSRQGDGSTAASRMSFGKWQGDETAVVVRLR